VKKKNHLVTVQSRIQFKLLKVNGCCNLIYARIQKIDFLHPHTEMTLQKPLEQQFHC